MFALRLLSIGLLIALSTIFHVLPLLLVAMFKVLLPLPALRRASDPLLTGLAASWIGFNGWMWDRLTDTRLQVQGDGALARDGHYLVLANHQSWVDILVLQKVFNRRIPLLRETEAGPLTVVQLSSQALSGEPPLKTLLPLDLKPGDLLALSLARLQRLANWPSSS